MADHRDYADEPRQPSLFDVLAPPSARPRPREAEQQLEGGQVVEFPRRREASAEPEVPAGSVELGAPGAAGYVEPAPALAPEDEWLTELAPDVDETERAMFAPAETDLAPGQLAGEPRTQRAAGLPLSGPTLDDVMSRVWEGLGMRLPAACPVCAGEVLPAAHGGGGSCTACGTTIE